MVEGGVRGISDDNIMKEVVIFVSFFGEAIAVSKMSLRSGRVENTRPDLRACCSGKLLCCIFSGEPVPRSLEGLFVYEERSTSPPANDTIVVEQWTVIEVRNSKDTHPESP